MIRVHALKHGDYNHQLPTTGWIYLHGELQEEAGFDLCHIDQVPEEEGIYDCEVILPNHDTRQCKLYYWKSKRRKIDRGLIVLADHPGDNKFAEIKYRIRSDGL